MSIESFLKGQFRSVIEWEPQDSTLLLYRFPAETDEIKNASKLIIGPGQGAMIVYEGKIENTISTPGTYDLTTSNHPFVTTLLKFKQAFESEHKMHIFYYRTAQNLNVLWGTPSPVKYIDSVYKIPVQLGVSGNYSFVIEKPELFFKTMVGAVDSYTVNDAKRLFLSRIEQPLRTFLAGAKLSYQNIDAQLSELSAELKIKLNALFDTLGFHLTDFRITGTAFDEDTEKRIDAIADIEAEKQAAQAGGMSYVELEKLKALRDAAKNPGGLAGAGLQMGVGLQLGKTFLPESAAVAGEEPVAKENKDHVAESETQNKLNLIEQLKALKGLADAGILTAKEFEDKKKDILSRI